MKSIFDGAKLGGMTLKNRIFRSATWLGAADDDGNLNAEIYKIYRAIAAGGVGAIVTGITTISPHDTLLDGIAQFHDDKFIVQHKILTDEVHKFGAKIYRVTINQLTAENISEVVELFGAATARAKAAGYDGIQIHAAHGFF